MASRVDWGRIDDLAPFISVLVLKKSSGRALAQVMDAVAKRLRAGERRSLFSDPEPLTVATAGLVVYRFHYVELRPPGWMVREPSATIKDKLHHAVIAVAHGDFLAVHLSEQDAASEVLSGARKSELGLSVFEPSYLEDRLARGPARTLWLGTVHRSAPYRADSKVLSGESLTYALDPFEDGGYAFSSVRSDHGTNGTRDVIGLSPGKARVWTGPAKDLEVFAKKTKQLLELVAQPTALDRESESFRNLVAHRATTRDVSEAFELTVVHPDLVEERARESEDTSALRRRWAEEYDLEVTGSSTSSFDITVSDVACTMHGDLAVDGRRLLITCASGHEDGKGSCADARKVLSKRSWVTLRYASGHTWTDGELFEMRLRPAGFDPEWLPVPPDVDIREEKPRKAKKTKRGRDATKNGKIVLSPTLSPKRLQHNLPSADGRSERSLFNWIWERNEPKLAGTNGWLVCDDGSGERADFIYVERLKDGDAVLRLIHVKGCHSTGNGVSLGDFEVVVAQAVKNLRWLDLVELSSLLEAPSPSLYDLVLAPTAHKSDGRPLREQFVSEASGFQHRYRREVVVVQPALSESNWGTGKQTSRELLQTLLASAESTCRGLGASFTVYGRK